jgi:hypothetical protein
MKLLRRPMNACGGEGGNHNNASRSLEANVMVCPGSDKSTTFDGRDHAVRGAKNGLTLSGRRRGPRALEYTEKNRGSVERARRFELSRDGRTLTETLHTAGRSTPDVFVFEREQLGLGLWWPVLIGGFGGHWLSCFSSSVRRSGARASGSLIDSIPLSRFPNSRFQAGILGRKVAPHLGLHTLVDLAEIPWSRIHPADPFDDTSDATITPANRERQLRQTSRKRFHPPARSLIDTRKIRSSIILKPKKTQDFQIGLLRISGPIPSVENPNLIQREMPKITLDLF